MRASLPLSRMPAFAAAAATIIAGTGGCTTFHQG